MTSLNEILTPTLLLEKARMLNNVNRMAQHIHGLGCRLRPHVKTHKSRDVLAQVKAISGNEGITVSTLHEARYFAEGGETDILYAVGMTPQKVPEAADLMRGGCALTVITDNDAMASLLDTAADTNDVTLDVLIELDVDGHRSGVDPSGAALVDIANTIHTAAHLRLKGVMTHAGGSYDCRSTAAIAERAKEERDKTVLAAARLRDAGLPCPVVSIGSTPTAVMAQDLTGVTEIRPGVYTFFDLFQTGLGIAQHSDIALSVLTTVIGHQPEKGWVIVDAGWMAMSRDRCTEKQAIDQGYGLVCELSGAVLGDVIMGGANQEHGILTAREGSPALNLEDFPVGSRWRVLPNHACATAGQYGSYFILENGSITETWSRTRGW